MTRLYEPQRDQEFLVDVLNKTLSFRTVVVDVAADRPSGLVLARLTATGVYVPWDNVGTDGSETVAGILLRKQEGMGANATAEATIVEWGAVVTDGQGRLTYPAGTRAALRAELDALKIRLLD